MSSQISLQFANVLYDAICLNKSERNELGEHPFFFMYFFNKAKGNIDTLWDFAYDFYKSENGKKLRKWWRKIFHACRAPNVGKVHDERRKLRKEMEDLRKELGIESETLDTIGAQTVLKFIGLDQALKKVLSRFNISRYALKIVNPTFRQLVVKDAVKSINNCPRLAHMISGVRLSDSGARLTMNSSDESFKVMYSECLKKPNDSDTLVDLTTEELAAILK